MHHRVHRVREQRPRRRLRRGTAACTTSTSAGPRRTKLVFQFNWRHALATDTADKGHLLKSRALRPTSSTTGSPARPGTTATRSTSPTAASASSWATSSRRGPNAGQRDPPRLRRGGVRTPGRTRSSSSSNTFVNDFTAAARSSTSRAAGCSRRARQHLRGHGHAVEHRRALGGQPERGPIRSSSRPRRTTTTCWPARRRSARPSSWLPSSRLP